MVETPCSIRESFLLASRYLVRAGKESSLPNRLAVLESCTAPQSRAQDDRSLPISRTNVALRHIPKQPFGETAGDALLLLLPKHRLNQVRMVLLSSRVPYRENEDRAF